MSGTDGEGDAQADLLPELRHTLEEAQRARVSTRKPADAVEVAAENPVAAVLVDVPLAHLDRPFDYLVPASMAEAAQPGVRVKVRFAGQDVGGFVVARLATSAHPRLRPLRRVVSAEQVLSPAIAELSGTVAQWYAGARADVLRLAVVPRHARAEKRESPPAPSRPAIAATLPAAEQAWRDHEHGPAFLRHLARGTPARAVWTAAPATDASALLAQAAATAYAAGRGVVMCLPDHRDVDRLDAALRRLLGEGHHVVLRADAGPERRYRDFLAVSRGSAGIVIGNRSAVWAPVAHLGLIAVWDDGDDLHAEPRAPYPHTLTVARMRAEQEGAAALIGAHARSVESLGLQRSGWAQPIAASRGVVRERVRVSVTGATDHDLARDPFARIARFPAAARDVVRDGLQSGPVLVVTPRSGYAAGLACEQCRTGARCVRCSGPLWQPVASAPPTCRWCGRAEHAWRCEVCGHTGLRAPVVGDSRTAEELGRAFPQILVRTSSADRVLAEVPDEPAIVVATPGAEPVVAGEGYGAVVLLDAWAMLARVELRTGEEALRRWMNAAALVRPGASVLVVGDPASPVIQALVRWDPLGYAQREATERIAAHLPPGARLATVSGDEEALETYLEAARAHGLPEPTEFLGPTPVPRRSGPATAEEEFRYVLRVPIADAAALAEVLSATARERSARKLAAVRVQLDPWTL